MRNYNYLYFNQLLCPEQEGFLPQLGTNDSIGKFLSDVYVNLYYSNNGVSTTALYFDLKKAFDALNRPILLYQLKLLGFKGQAIKLLTNYFNDRCQATRLNNAVSPYLKQNMAYPRGPLSCRQCWSFKIYWYHEPSTQPIPWLVFLQ